MAGFTKSLFFKPKNKVLASKISITSPSAFNKSISNLKSGGITLEEKKALVLARTRASAQLMRKNLSSKERNQFTKIAATDIPNVTRRRKRK